MTSLLSIGIGDYSVAARFAPDLENLDYGVSDALRFSQVARSTLSIGESRTLTSLSLHDARATRLNIIRSVMEIAENPDSTAIIYFAGHGVDIGGSLYLCPNDYDPRVPEHSSIGVSFLDSALAANKQWSLIILDACRASPRPPSRLGKVSRSGGVHVSDNVCILLGCSNGQRSFETASVNGEPAGGLFTHFLCKRLLASPFGAAGIDMAELFPNVQIDVSEFASTEAMRSQTPRAVGLSLADVILGTNPDRRADDPPLVHPLMADADEDAGPLPSRFDSMTPPP